MRGRIQELWGNTQYSNISEIGVLEEKRYGYIFLQNVYRHQPMAARSQKNTRKICISTMQVRGNWSDIFKVLKEKKVNS